MKASHESMIVRVRYGDGAEAPLVLEPGSTLQQALERIDEELAYLLNAVTINGRSASRLTPLLPGDRIVIPEDALA
ncbi:MAG: hypothetical protein ACF8PN_16130 [Phycisphaerales bacterium]